MPTARTAATALLLTLLSLPVCASAAGRQRPQQPDCSRMQELYRACHALGKQSADAAGCEEAGREHVARALRANGAGQGNFGQVMPSQPNPSLTARAQAAVVCATACDDAATGQAPATDQEVAEAFCDQTAPAKAQGARP